MLSSYITKWKSKLQQYTTRIHKSSNGMSRLMKPKLMNPLSLIIVAALGLVIIGAAVFSSLGTGHKVHASTVQDKIPIYDVFKNGVKLGSIHSPQVVDSYMDLRKQQLQAEHPGVKMELDPLELTYKKEMVPLDQTTVNEQHTLMEIDGMLHLHAVAIALKVDGELVGYVKDQQTADQILKQVKEDALFRQGSAEKGQVKILSAASDSNVLDQHLLKQEVGFEETVDQEEAAIEPGGFSDPQEIVKRLETGGVQPYLYTVKKGDCISCIASDFNISSKVIYENNPSVKNDLLHVGDKLNLAVYKPELSVKTVNTVKQTEKIPYDKKYIDNKDMLKGTYRTIKDGHDGKKTVTMLVTEIDGIVKDTEVLDEEVLDQPITAEIYQGTKIISGLGTGHYRWPVSSPRITSGYGYRRGIFKSGTEFHDGLDIVSRSGNRKLYATDNGKVIFSGWKNGFGNTIKIDHLNGYVSLYGHLSKRYVRVGQIVEKGQVIGYMGETGWATGIHVHYSLYYHGSTVNPSKYLGK